MRFFVAPSSDINSIFHLTFQIFTQFAAADGKIVASEIRAIERFARNELGLSKRLQKAVLGVVRETNCEKGEFEKSVQKLYDTVSGNRIILESVFDVLLAIAKADRSFAIEERQYWIKAGQICNFSERDLKRLMARHIAQPRMRAKRRPGKRRTWRKEGGFRSASRSRKNKSQRSQRNKSQQTSYQQNYFQPMCYQILGADQNEDFDSIKSKYRKLVKESHPDTIASQGVPKEFLKTIEARFREIQEAYEEVCRLRGES